MSLPMARDLARFGIRVNCIAPGIMDTPMMQVMPKKVQDNLLGRYELERPFENFPSVYFLLPIAFSLLHLFCSAHTHSLFSMSILAHTILSPHS